MKNSARGFTILELLIVVSIISILTAIAVSSFTNLQKSSRDARRKSDLALTQSALEQYRADQGFYPNGVTPGAPLTSPSGSKTYQSKLPNDPSNTCGTDETCYQYFYTASPLSCNNTTGNYCNKYCLYARMENSSNAQTSTDCPATSKSNYSVQTP